MSADPETNPPQQNEGEGTEDTGNSAGNSDEKSEESTEDGEKSI